MKSIPARIENGKLVYNELSFTKFSLVNEGKSCDIVRRDKPRSLSQLGMYRAWLRKVADDTGNDEEALHESLLDWFAPRVVVQIRGPKGVVERTEHKRTSGGHTLSMNKEEMSEFMDKASIRTEHPLPTREELEAMGYILNY